MHAFPSLANFGTHREALHPELWDGCVHAYCPSLGITGLRLFDFTNTDQRWGTFSNLSEDSWSLQAGRPQLDLTFLGATSVNLGTFAPRVYDAASVSAWVYRSEDRADVRIFSAGSSLYLSMFGTSGRLRGGFGSAIATDPSSTVTLNRWHHVVFTYCNGIPRVWVNGELRQTGTTTVATISSTALAHRIGSNSTGTGLYWPGSLDDVRVYNRELTHGEIETLTSFRGVSYVRGRNRRIVWSAELDAAVAGPAQTVAAPVITAVTGYPISTWSDAGTDQIVWQDGSGVIWAGVSPVDIIYDQSATVPASAARALAFQPIVSQSSAVPVIAAAASVIAPATIVPGGGAQSVAVPQVTASGAVTAPTVSVGPVSISLPIVSAIAAVTAPAIGIGLISLTPPVISTAATATAPGVLVGAVTVPAPNATSVATVTAPTIRPAISLVAPSLSAIGSVTAPTVTIGAVSISAPIASATGTATAPGIGSSIAIGAPLAAAVASATPPGVIGPPQTLSAPVAVAGASVLAPSVFLGSAPPQQLSLPVLVAGAAATAPAVLAGAVSILVPTATAGASATAPGIQPGGVSVAVPGASGAASATPPASVPGLATIVASVVQATGSATAPGVTQTGAVLAAPVPAAAATATAPVVLRQTIPTADLTCDRATWSLTVQIRRSDYGSGGLSV
jgi:Concanavalin A-like lectin/glucanases superfamily